MWTYYYIAFVQRQCTDTLSHVRHVVNDLKPERKEVVHMHKKKKETRAFQRQVCTKFNIFRQRSLRLHVSLQLYDRCRKHANQEELQYWDIIDYTFMSEESTTEQDGDDEPVITGHTPVWRSEDTFYNSCSIILITRCVCMQCQHKFIIILCVCV